MKHYILEFDGPTGGTTHTFATDKPLTDNLVIKALKKLTRHFSVPVASMTPHPNQVQVNGPWPVERVILCMILWADADDEWDDMGYHVTIKETDSHITL